MMKRGRRMTTSECMSFIYIPALCIRSACTFLTYGHATPPSSVRRRSWRPSNVVHEVGQASPAAPARHHGDAVGAPPVVGGGVGHHDRRAGGTDAGGDGARDGVAGADAEQGARRARGWSWRCRRRRGAGSASRKPLVVATVVYVVETTSQLVHVPSSATASGVTTVAQVVQLQVATLRVTASPLPTRNREHVAQAVGRGGRVSAVERGGSSWQEGVAVVDKVWLPR